MQRLQTATMFRLCRLARRTEDDAVELVGAGVVVGQQDAAGLQNCEELRLSWLRESGEEGVGALGHTLLQHRSIVGHRCNILHTPPAVTWIALCNIEI